MLKQIEKKLPAIKKVFDKKGVVLALLFGSAVKGKQTKLSDLDFAVLLPKNTPKKKYLDFQLELAGQLGKVTKSQVDVVILNEASPFIRQMAISHGRVIFCQDKDLMAQFFTQSRHKFDDALYISRISDQYLKQRVFNNKLGEKL